MGSWSFKQEEDKTAFESLLAAADQLLINSPLDDVTSWAPGTTKLTKGMCVCVHRGVHRHSWPKILYRTDVACVWFHTPGLCMHLRLYCILLCVYVWMGCE